MESLIIFHLPPQVEQTPEEQVLQEPACPAGRPLCSDAAELNASASGRTVRTALKTRWAGEPQSGQAGSTLSFIPLLTSKTFLHFEHL
jgi:hypothetical protein